MEGAAEAVESLMEQLEQPLKRNSRTEQLERAGEQMSQSKTTTCSARGGDEGGGSRPPKSVG